MSDHPTSLAIHNLWKTIKENVISNYNQRGI